MPQVAGCAVRGEHPGPCGWGCLGIGWELTREATLEQEMSTWAPLTKSGEVGPWSPQRQSYSGHQSSPWIPDVSGQEKHPWLVMGSGFGHGVGLRPCAHAAATVTSWVRRTHGLP